MLVLLPLSTESCYGCGGDAFGQDKGSSCWMMDCLKQSAEMKLSASLVVLVFWNAEIVFRFSCVSAV